MTQNLPHCQNIAPGRIYNCSNPWPQCESGSRFNFSTLWNYTHSIHSACSSDERLFGVARGLLVTLQNASLTNSACATAAKSGWRHYPLADIWVRLTIWKFPLLQLASVFPRPPLDFAVESFVVAHLLGDPIGTIADLLWKLSICQERAEMWQGDREGQHDWKALTLITDAFAEWGKDKEVAHILTVALFVLHCHGIMF